MNNMETKFNFNSAICTSRSQSERLLALGLKKETADMCWTEVGTKSRTYYVPELAPINMVSWMHTPAWSLHRLIEIMPENVTSDDWLGVSFDDVSYYHGEGDGILGWKFYKSGNLYDCIVDAYEWLIKEGYFNKEFLCEK